MPRNSSNANQVAPVELRSCIYCRQEKPFSTDKSVSAFNREHVVHDGLLYAINEPLILRGIVCSDCNKALGRDVDQKFLRSGYVGMLRFDNGVKSPEDFADFDSKTLSLTASAANVPAHGAPMKRSSTSNGLHTEFKAKIAILTKSGWVHLTEEQIDDGDVPKAEDLSGPSQFLCDTDEEEVRIRSKLSKYFSFQPSEEKVVIGDLSVIGSGEIGFDEKRALAKIAFNYLAYISNNALGNKDVLQYPCFDEIRNFIRYGHLPSSEVVFMERGDPMLTAGPNLSTRDKHLVSLHMETDGNRRIVTARVQLFNSMVWRILLSSNYAGIIQPTSYGHVWDLTAKTCKPFPVVNEV